MVQRPALPSTRPSRRVALLAVVVLAILVTAVGYGLFVLVPADRHGTRIDTLSTHGEFGPGGPDAGRYVATASLEVRNRSSGSLLVIRAAAWHGRANRSAGTVTRWVRSANDSSSALEWYHNGTAQFTRRTVPADEPFGLEAARYRSRDWRVDTDRPNRTIYTQNPQPPDVMMRYPRLAMLVLDTLEYRRVGTTTADGRELVVYEPVTGWVTRETGFRRYVSAASGRVLVDPDEGTVVRADVSVTTIHAERWADVLTEPRIDLEIQYQLEPTAAVAVDRPGWTSRVANGTAAG